MSGLFSKIISGLASKLESRAPELGAVHFTPEIVGESFYKESFKEIRQGLGLKTGDQANVRVELAQDPTNEFSRSGKAVAVFVEGLKVGHVSELDSAKTFEYLDAHGGRVTVPGRVYFGDLRETVSKNSVSIKLSIIRMTKEEHKKSVEVETSKARSRAKLDERTEEWEKLKREFLRNPQWSNLEVRSGDKVVFSGFADHGDSLNRILAELDGEPNQLGPQTLLVLHPGIIETSAKLRDALGRSKPATDLETFLKNNPKFSKADVR